jgi:hypothetical protein
MMPGSAATTCSREKRQFHNTKGVAPSSPRVDALRVPRGYPGKTFARIFNRNAVAPLSGLS